MKKVLLTMALIGAMNILPIKTLAMLEVDENGNPVTKETTDSDVSVMMAPDDGTVSNEPSNGDVELYTATDADDEIYQTTAAEDKAETVAAEDDEDSSWPGALLYGGVGLVLGVGGTYLVMRKK